MHGIDHGLQVTTANKESIPNFIILEYIFYCVKNVCIVQISNIIPKGGVTNENC